MICTGNFSVVQLTSLESFYNSTGGSRNWIWSQNYTQDGIPWNFTVTDTAINPCQSRWQYLTCNSNCEVMSLIFYKVGLTGTLPGDVFLGLASSLTTLIINNRSPALTGPIPWSVSSLTNLETLDLSYNNFTGRIPSDLGNGLSQGGRCQVILMERNSLTGPLPDSLGLVTSLIHFEVHVNHFTGSIPSTYTNLISLQEFDIGTNHINGTIPSNIGDMVSLVSLNLSSNAITGSIPDSLYSLANLSDIELSNNHLTGTLSSKIQGLHSLTYLQADHNLLRGELPDELGTLSNLVALYLHFNHLTGYIPSTFGNLYQLESMYLSNNHLSGTLPDTFQTLSHLQLLNMSHNFLHGTLSTSIYSLNRLKYLDISYNLFSGQIGSFVAEMNNLTAAFLQDNYLTGPVNNLVDPSTQQLLAFIDIAYNAFTGQIPDKVFQLPSIKVFCSMHNCFEGSMPSTICEANQTLIVLGLDGIHSSPRCTSPYMATSNSYPLFHIIEGSIPSCLLEDFPHLTTLHMSGNGIENKLPHVTNVSKALQDLTLSHNQLTGTIPNAIMSHPWRILDLSFNKLSGTIPHNVHDFSDIYPTVNASSSAKYSTATSTASELYLQINRLSGSIPSKLRSANHINILEGNIFYCDVTKSTLPINDPDHQSYDCGSNNVNFTIEIWIGLVCFLLGLVVLHIFRNVLFKDWKWIINQLTTIENYILGYWEIFRSNASPLFFEQSIEQLVEVGLVCRQLRVWIMKMTFLTIVIFVPLYLGFNSAYSMYRYSYAWALSMGFFSGIPPAVVMTLILAFFLIIVFFRPFRILRINIHYLIDHMSTKSDRLYRHIQQSSSEKRIRPVTVRLSSFNWSLYRNVGLLILVDAVLVLLVNIGYVTVTGSHDYHLATKQVVGVLVTLFKVGWNNVIFLMFKFAVNKKSVLHMDDELYSFFATCMTWLSVFNQVISPCIAELLFNANCFDYTINSAPNVDISYTAPLCSIMFSAKNGLPTIDCSGIQIQTRTFNPPFFYSYQCSSSIMTDFVEIFILRFFISGLLIPMFRIMCKLIQETIRTRYGINHPLLKYLNPLIPFPLRMYQKPVEDWNVIPIPAQLFKAENFIIDVITDIAIVMTFGVIFPPLAFVGCISIMLSTTITQLMLGRLVYLARTQPDLLDIVQKVNNDCAGVRAAAARGLIPLSAVLALFWAYFLFDILGDVVGFRKALSVLVLMTMIPTFIFVANFFFRKWEKSKQGFDNVQDSKLSAATSGDDKIQEQSFNGTETEVELAIIRAGTRTVGFVDEENVSNNISVNPIIEHISRRPLPNAPISAPSLQDEINDIQDDGKP